MRRFTPRPILEDPAQTENEVSELVSKCPQDPVGSAGFHRTEEQRESSVRVTAGRLSS